METQTATFISDRFLLHSSLAEELYADYAAEMPIIDYHCHLPPADIATNRQFGDLTDIWLDGDHYKWRAMRTHGVKETYITGSASNWEKFKAYAETVPYTLRNPLYHWTHMELQNPFGIYELLSPSTAESIYQTANDCLQKDDFRVREILKKRKVKVVGTTDDPADELSFHQRMAEDGSMPFQVVPSFRPDKSFATADPVSYTLYLDSLGQRADKDIKTYEDLLTVLKERASFFHALGGRLSDHGLERVYATTYTESEVKSIFRKIRDGKILDIIEQEKLTSALLYELGCMYHELGWTMQFHLGAMRNNSGRMMQKLGPDTGFDSIGDYVQAPSLATYLNRLDKEDKLTRTILYNLNPADNEVFATMVGNFNDGSEPGKMQWGSAWWFLDQKEGMIQQINALSNMGLLSHFVGMLTDSRSFLSYSRHEYFRRLLCNLFAEDVLKGELPHDVPWLGKIIQDICYRNAARYFKFDQTKE
ncbi:MAG: glucuronate isomerase [Bacteroidota bacterium]